MMRRGSMAAGCAAGLLLLLSGCHSPRISCTIVNHESAPVSLVEVNYPGGSFGVQTIAAGAGDYSRVHALGNDTPNIDFTGAARQSHTVSGPELKLNDEGWLAIEILDGNKVRWTPVLTMRR